MFTRIAVDRFSGAVKDKALLTEQSVLYGDGELIIKIDRSIDKKALYALIAVIADLGMGCLAVGGETSIGRGIFEITEMMINGNTVKPIDFNGMKTMLEEVLKNV